MPSTKRTLLLILLAAFFASVNAQPLTRLLFVFDASNSMNARWESESKIKIADRLLASSLSELDGKKNLELALRVYGHQTQIRPGEQDCDDTKLEVPFGENNANRIREVLRDITPKGTTPIARSLEKAAGDFPECSNCRNVIILITDGIEACDEDPCAVSRALQKKGIILKPFVIGIGLGEEFIKTFECVGNYYDASSEAMFQSVLQIVIAEALNTTTAQVDLLTVDGKPLETNVAMTFYDANTGQVEYNYVHTLNERQLPDTLTIDPLFKYNIVVHTIPPVVAKNVTIAAGEHTTIPINAPRGELDIKLQGGRAMHRTVQAIIRKKDEMPTLHVQELNTTQLYIVGNYDLEVLTLPRTMIKNVKIEQSETTVVEIPKPGVVNLMTSSPGYGSIFKTNGDELEWVCDLDPFAFRTQYVFQPGSYKILYRSKTSRKTVYSLEKEFTVESGASETLNF